MGLAIFRSRLRSEFEEEYRAMAPRMLELAQAAPGFGSFKSFAAANRERVSIIHRVRVARVPAGLAQPSRPLSGPAARPQALLLRIPPADLRPGAFVLLGGRPPHHRLTPIQKRDP